MNKYRKEGSLIIQNAGLFAKNKFLQLSFFGAPDYLTTLEVELVNQKLDCQYNNNFMEPMNVFENIEAIKIENPVDKIIKQLKMLITTGQLRAGDRLPAERVLADKFGVGRSYIREAILKLEFYGLLKTSPQSGTYVAGFSIKIMDSIFSDIINLNKSDFPSLIEARFYTEITAARLAAERRTQIDIDYMKEALSEFDAKIQRGVEAIEEDLLFHIKIAGATKNSVIESMILILIPDIIHLKTLMGKDIEKERNYSIAQHHKILTAIIQQDILGAGVAMGEHLQSVLNNRWDIVLPA